MKLLAPILASVALASASANVYVESPEIASVSSFLTPDWKQLHYDASASSLVASITVSNVHYVSDTEPRRDERHDFTIPGVIYDQKTRNFLLKGEHGHSLIVAARHALSVDLTSNTRILMKRSGGVMRLELQASDQPLPGPRWVELP
jgi:hypothetical protein